MENIFKGINAIEFGKKFRNNTDCLDYLVKHKWDNGYSCVSCKCIAFIKGRTSHYRRCKAFYYDESALSNTLFHGIKMPILKAFHMLYRVVAYFGESVPTHNKSLMN